jgi:hypothetical protein
VEKDTLQPCYLVRVLANGARSGSSVSRWVTLANCADEAVEKVAPFLKPRQVFDTSEPPTPLPLETLRRMKLGVGEVRRLPIPLPIIRGRRSDPPPPQPCPRRGFKPATASLAVNWLADFLARIGHRRLVLFRHWLCLSAALALRCTMSV